MLNSTIRIDEKTANFIRYFASSTEISGTAIIKILLKRLNTRYCYTPSVPGLIKYQQNQPSKYWKLVHITMTQNEKELFDAMRSKYKLSISFMVQIAFLLFFNDMVNSISGKIKTLNKFIYSYTTYLEIYKKFINSCWILTDNKP